MNRLITLTFITLITLSYSCSTNIKRDRTPISEATPSKSMYFDWINSNWYGNNENKVMNNLLFFKWLNQEYGMKLDIYLLDAGNIDNGPNCRGCEEDIDNTPQYAGIESEWFRNKYPNGLDSIVCLANSFGCQIGLWIGPDGYGYNDSTAQKRIEMLDKLTRDYNIAVFKMDACCSELNSDNEKYFIQAMQKCYANNPELIVLNHRIKLSDEAKKYTSTFLWEGAETYIGVSACNAKPSPHHRYTLGRGLPPGLKRLTEDHGVCLSSFLDYWEDDLILQAFNRDLILAPEIYGNPWFLNDTEFSLLSRIFNLQKQFGKILTKGIVLPEENYGQNAVSRGDENTRLITLRNLSWEPKKYAVNINESIGLSPASEFEVRQYHPFESILGTFEFGQQVEVEVLPFRSCLLKISSEPVELGVEGCNYQIVRNVSGKEVEIDLLAFPGEEKKINLVGTASEFNSAKINGQDASELLSQRAVTLKFEGDKSKSNYHRHLGTLDETTIPKETSQFIETMFFTATNNCLEIQSLKRSGGTSIESVKNARDAFLYDEVFAKIGAWDQFALDQNSSTSFKVRKCQNLVNPGIFRAQLPSSKFVDEIRIEGVEDGYQPIEALVSNDLIKWQKAKILLEPGVITLQTKKAGPIQFLKLKPAPLNVTEIKATNGQPIDISQAKLTNLFPDSRLLEVKKAWKGKFTLSELNENSTLAIAIEGDYGEDGAFAVVQINDSLIGAFDRSPTFPFNNWEYIKAPQNGNYTYYFKVPEKFANQELTVYVFGLKNTEMIQKPEVWLTAYPIPFNRKRLVLK